MSGIISTPPSAIIRGCKIPGDIGIKICQLFTDPKDIKNVSEVSKAFFEWNKRVYPTDIEKLAIAHPPLYRLIIEEDHTATTKNKDLPTAKQYANLYFYSLKEAKHKLGK